MISAVIIDDEMHGRLALREKLKLFCPDVEVVAEAENGKLGLEIIKKYKPEIIFLDVEMPEMSGFELLSNLKDRTGHIVFTTAYNQYAIKAIKHAAFDYLLKPIDIEELKSTIQKARETEIPDERKVLLQPNKPFSKLAVASLEGLQFLTIVYIIHLEADSNYTTFYPKTAVNWCPARVSSNMKKSWNHTIFSVVTIRISSIWIVSTSTLKMMVGRSY